MSDAQNSTVTNGHDDNARPARLESLWTFEDGAGATAADRTEKGHTLHGVGDFSWSSADRRGGAVALDGISGRFATEKAVLRTDESFSVAAWVRLDSAAVARFPDREPEPGEYAWTAVSQGVGSHGAFYLGARRFREGQSDVPTDNLLHWSFTVSPIDGPTSDFEWRHATSAAPVSATPLDTWVLLVGILDRAADTARIIIPGAADSRTVALPEGWTYWHADTPLQVGHGTWLEKVVDLWPGAIGPIRLYSGALSDDEVDALYAAG
ncbi:LamG-like jellyroll fold domain-containing protein [Nocardia takedensis]